MCLSAYVRVLCYACDSMCKEDEADEAEEESWWFGLSAPKAPSLTAS